MKTERVMHRRARKKQAVPHFRNVPEAGDKKVPLFAIGDESEEGDVNQFFDGR